MTEMANEQKKNVNIDTCSFYSLEMANTGNVRTYGQFITACDASASPHGGVL